MAVEGPSKAEISCHDNKDGTISVSYLPTAPGEYKIAVKFGEKHIKGSPFNAKITGNKHFRQVVFLQMSESNYHRTLPMYLVLKVALFLPVQVSTVCITSIFFSSLVTVLYIQLVYLVIVISVNN